MPVVENEWSLRPGDSLPRSQLHDRYGGARQGGIEPSGSTPNVFLFTAPASGERFGYPFDGWHVDGTFHYTGEGQLNDQLMTYGNRSVRDHKAAGRSLRLFRAEGTTVHYVGEFEIPDDSHVLIDEAPDREGRPRKVFVFRLVPVGDVARARGESVAPAPLVEAIEIESSDVETYVVQHIDEEVAAVRLEAALVARYAEWLKRKGHASNRHKVPTPGGRIMYTDLFDQSRRELVEAKSSASRTHVRTALGQILDYGRYVDHNLLAVLLPSEPEPDLVELLTANGVCCIWESKAEFVRREAP